MNLRELQIEYPECSKTLLFALKDLLAELTNDDIKTYTIKVRNLS